MISFHIIVFIVTKLMNIQSPISQAKTDYALYLYSMIAMVKDALIFFICIIMYVQPYY